MRFSVEGGWASPYSFFSTKIPFFWPEWLWNKSSSMAWVGRIRVFSMLRSMAIRVPICLLNRVSRDIMLGRKSSVGDIPFLLKKSIISCRVLEWFVRHFCAKVLNVVAVSRSILRTTFSCFSMIVRFLKQEDRFGKRDKLILTGL